MYLMNKELDNITESDIQQLIDEEIIEKKHWNSLPPRFNILSHLGFNLFIV